MDWYNEEYFDYERDPDVPEEYKTKKTKESSWFDDFLSYGSAESDMYVRPEPAPRHKPTDEDRIPKLSTAEPQTFWQKTADTIDDFISPHAPGTMDPGKIADAQIKTEARKNIVKDKTDTGKTIYRPQYKEEYMDEVDPENSNVRKATQLYKDFGVGALLTAKGMAGAAEWVSDGLVGGDLANQAKLWAQDLTGEEQDFSNQLAQGAGSMATFFIPGMGVARGASALAKVSPKLAQWMGAGTMTAMEAMTEAGSVYRDVLQETKDPMKASLAATETFTLNVPLLTITNKLGMFGESGTAIKRALMSSIMEGGQEAGQEIISTTSAGKPIKWGDVATSAAIGGIIGGGAGMISHGMMPQMHSDSITDDQNIAADRAAASNAVPEGTDGSFLTKRLIENGSLDDVKFALSPENAKLWTPEERTHLERHYARLQATESPTAKMDKAVDDHLQGKSTSADLLYTFAGEFDNLEDLLREEPADVNARKIRYGDKQPELDLGTSSTPLFDMKDQSSPSEIVDSTANGEAVISPTISSSSADKETWAEKRTREQIEETHDVPINPKVAPLVSALNKADIPTNLSGDLYGRGVLYVDLPGGTYVKGELAEGSDEYEKKLQSVKLPEGWSVIPTDMTGSTGFIAGQEKPYNGPRSTRTRLIKKGDAVTPEEVKQLVDAVQAVVSTEQESPMLQEARKHKTAADFVKAKVNAYHGTSADEFDEFNGDVAYFTREKGEAEAFSTNPILGGGRGVGTPRVLEVALPEGKTKNIDDGVQEVIMEEHPDFETLDDYIAHEAKIARQEGYDYLSFNHPSSVHGGEFEAIVAVNPQKVKTKKQLENIHKAAAKKTSVESPSGEYGEKEKADSFYSNTASILEQQGETAMPPAEWKKRIEAWGQKFVGIREENQWSGLLEYIDSRSNEKKIPKADLLEYMEETKKGWLQQENEPDDRWSSRNLPGGIPGTEQTWTYSMPGGKAGSKLRPDLKIRRLTTKDLANPDIDATALGPLSDMIAEGEIKAGDWGMFEAGRDASKQFLLWGAPVGTEAEARNYFTTFVADLEFDEFLVNVDEDTYASPHFPGRPNVLLHIRTQKRYDENGRIGLLAETIQSDWHQEGRDKGYREGENTVTVEETSDGKFQVYLGERPVGVPYNRRQDAEKNIGHPEYFEGYGAVPDAPFKDTWHELGLKRLIDIAAKDPEVEWIGWTPGQAQAERWGKAQRIDTLQYVKQDDGTYTYTGWEGDRVVRTWENLSREEAIKTFGEDAIKEIESNKTHGEPSYTGNILLNKSIGGDYLKLLYDKKLPKFADKYVKKWGTKVEKVNVGGGAKSYEVGQGGDGRWNVVERPGGVIQSGLSSRETAEALATAYRDEAGQKVHAINITPQMREEITTKGQAFYEPKANYATKALNALEKAVDFFTAGLSRPGVLNRSGKDADRNAAGVRGKEKRHHTVGKMVDDLKDLKMVRLRGIEAKTWNDVYEALRITRNKNVEILQVLYIGEKSGKILYNEACSSRLPGAVQIASPAILAASIHSTTLTLKRIAGEGVKVAIVHNHPSGDVTASEADKSMTASVAKHLKARKVEFEGHMIIDHNVYSVIDGDKVTKRSISDVPAEHATDPLLTIPVPHEKLDETLTRQDHMASIAKDINRGDKYFTLLMRSGTRIRGIVNIELGVLDNSRQATSYIKDLMVNHGAQDAFVYREGFSQGQINTLVDLVQGNTLRDAAWDGEEKLTGLAEQGVFGDANKQFGRDLEDYQGKWFEDYGTEFREGKAAYGTETASIIKKAKKNGTYLKAPNGEPTKLNPGQWAQVRTKAFKKWFGDWEAIANATPDREATTFDKAKEHAATFIGKELSNRETGLTATVSRTNLEKMTSASSSLKSSTAADHALAVANADKLFQNALLDSRHPDKKGEPTIAEIQRFVAPMINRNGKVVAVKLTVKRTTADNQPNPLYTIQTIEIEKLALDAPHSGIEWATDNDRNTPQASFSSNVRLLLDSVKPENASKVVDENGEPRVVYHGTRNDFHTFDSHKAGTGRGSEGEKAFFFAEKPDTANHTAMVLGDVDSFHRGGGRVLPVFLNMRRPFVSEQERYNTRIFEQEINDASAQGYDGMTWPRMTYESEADSIAVFSPNQIKSATGNRGTFDPEEASILKEGDAPYGLDNEKRSGNILPMSKDKGTGTKPPETTPTPVGGIFKGIKKEDLDSFEHPFFELDPDYDYNRRKGSIQAVGYRYGNAPEGGRSYNTRDNRHEEGVSMASAANSPENNLFATMSLRDKGVQRKYYKGDIIGFGGDDEPIMANVKSITKSQYENHIKSNEGGEAALLLKIDKLRTAEKLWRRGYSGYKEKALDLRKEVSDLYDKLFPNPPRPPEVGGRITKPTSVRDKDAPYGEDLGEPSEDDDGSFDFGANTEKAIDENPEEYISLDFSDHLDAYISTLNGMVQQGEPGKKLSDEITGEPIWWSSTYPEFMQDQGWTQKEVLAAMGHSIKGEEMTEKQREIVQAAVNQAVEMFYEDLQRWYPGLSVQQYNKAEASVRKATDEFLSRYYTNQKLLKQEKEKADRATMITKSKYQWEKEKKQTENRAWEKGAKAVHTVQDPIIEKLQRDLDATVVQRDRLRESTYRLMSEAKAKTKDTEEKDETALNEIRKLNNKIEKLKTSIEKARQNVKPKPPKKSTKALIRISTGQNLNDEVWISEYKLLTEQIRREAMAARKAFASGNKKGLLEARARYKMLQAQQRAMREIRRETRKIIKDFKKVLKQTSEMAPEYAEKIKALLEDFDLARMTGDTRLKLEAIREALITNPDADIDERTLDTLKRLEKIPIRNISYPGLKAMHDAVMHYATLGKRGPTMIMSQKKVTRDMILQRSIAAMKSAKEVSKEMADATYSGWKEAKARLAAAKDLYTIHLDTFDNLVESIAGMNSMVYRVLMREIKRGSNERDRITYELEDDFMAAQEAFQKRHPEIKDIMGWLSEEVEFAGIKMNRNLALSLYRGWFDPDFSRSIVESGFGLWGSQDRDNPNKVFKIAHDAYGASVNKLSKTEREYADLAIPTIQKSGDLLADKFLEINGYAMPRVEDGIYWRKEVLASERAQDEEQEQMKERFGRPYIFKGMTKKRTGSSAAVWLKPYTVAIREMHKRAADYVGLEEAMSNAAWLMYNKEFKAEIEARYGLPIWREMEKGLKDIAEISTPEAKGDIERFFRWLRNNSTIYALAANYGTMLKQLNGAFNYMVYVGPGCLARAISAYSKDPMAVKRLHRQMSVEYRRRRESGYSQDVGNVLQAINKQGLKPSLRERIGQKGLAPLQQVDIFGVDLGMLAATYQAMDAFKAGQMTDQMRMALDITDAQVKKLTTAEKAELAYRWADFVTERTQSQNVPEHMSGWQRGGELEKQLSMFFGELQKNLAGFARGYRAVKRGDPGAKALLLKTILLYAILGTAIDTGVNELRNRLRGRSGDKWWASLLKSASGYLPGIREVVSGVVDMTQGKYYAGGGDTPYERVRNASEKPFKATKGMITATTPKKRRENAKKFADGLANFVAMTVGIPYPAMKEPFRILNREEELRKARAAERR